MNASDKVIITADQSPQFFEELKKCQLGGEGTAELRFIKDEQGAESAVLSVKAWVPEGYEVADDEDVQPTAPAVSAGDAVMTPTSMMVRKKAGK